MRAIDEDDLRPASELNRSFFRATSPHLTREEFDAKWAAAKKSTALKFFRSFPQAYYLDLTWVNEARWPGQRLFCFGDLHPENFGFQAFGDHLEYVFNDLDDSGPAPVAVDALRYFVAVALTTDDLGHVDELIEFYRDVMRKPRTAEKLSRADFPTVDALRTKQLHKAVSGRRLIRGKETGLFSVSERMRTLLHATAKSLGATQVLDVTERQRDHGGSGGLQRYWLLLQRNGHLDVVELKELVTPATAWGQQLTELDNRLERAKALLWKKPLLDDNLLVRVGETNFLARSRVRRGPHSIDDLSLKDGLRLLRVQASIVALRHRRAFRPAELKTLPKFLQRSFRVIAKRWNTVHEQ